MRRLEQRHQQGGTNRIQIRNLTEQFHWAVFPALRQQIASRSLPQRLQRIQLLVEPLGSQANSRLYNLGQPFCTMTRSIHRWPGTGNSPASVHGLDPTHHPRQIFRD
ncbi:MAG: hypothetical protein WB723_04185, partial [Candidatus Acidiferrales bacterium]